MTINEAITKVNESAGSLFTKQDVINLITEIVPSTINLDTLQDRINAIIDDADDNEITFENDRCEFSIRSGNEIQLDDIYYETESFKDGIKYNIGQLMESMVNESVDIDSDEY